MAYANDITSDLTVKLYETEHTEIKWTENGKSRWNGNQRCKQSKVYHSFMHVLSGWIVELFDLNECIKNVYDVHEFNVEHPMKCDFFT